MPLNNADFYVSDTFGFLLENPLEVLPAYFEPWNHLARNMAQFVADNTMRDQVHQMALLDWTRLEGHREKRLAHLQLVIIASGYVWQYGEKGATQSLPKCVAVPLHNVSKDLGLPPVICHPDLGLANYARIDTTRPIDFDNVRALYCIPGGEELEWFVVVNVMMELTFAKCIKSVRATIEGVEKGDHKLITTSLLHIGEVVKEVQQMLARMHDKLTSDTFFNVLRPYLAGWGGETNPLPEGLIYEGVSDEPIQANGASAAQSAILQLLDALLGVEHTAEKKAFLMTMRDYMLPAHKRFIEAVENRTDTLLDFVNNSENEDTKRAYNAALQSIVNFRSYHIQIVTKYIVQPSARARQAEEKRFESLDKKGTGGTSLLPFLKGLRQDTKDRMTDTHSSSPKIIANGS